MGVRLVVRHPSTPDGAADEVAYELDQPRIVIGRGAGADVRLPDAAVSHSHAIIEVADGRYFVRDDGSTNGTWVNDQPLVAGRDRSLDQGDQLDVGPFSVHFTSGAVVGQPTTRERTASLARRLLRELLAPNNPARATPTLTVEAGPQQGARLTFPAPPVRLRVGRAPDSDFQLLDEEASNEHCLLSRDLDGVLVQDAGAKNGLLVNGEFMSERRLRDGDTLAVGQTLLRFSDPAEQALNEVGQAGDAHFERTATQVRPEPEPRPKPEPKRAGAPPTPVPALAAAPRRAEPVAVDRGLGADAIIYVLAAVVLVTSLAGLAWILG